MVHGEDPGEDLTLAQVGSQQPRQVRAPFAIQELESEKLKGPESQQFSFFDFLINRGIFVDFFMYVLYSTLFYLPPLRFHCVGGCWDRTQDS